MKTERRGTTLTCMWETAFPIGIPAKTAMTVGRLAEEQPQERGATRGRDSYRGKRAPGPARDAG